jgi:hypothetical protein
MNAKPTLYGPSTMPTESAQAPLLLHIKASLQWLVDHSR